MLLCAASRFHGQVLAVLGIVLVFVPSLLEVGSGF